MQHQLDRIIDVAESLLPPLTTTSRMGVDPPNCSITEYMSLLKCLPRFELGSELYMLGVGLSSSDSIERCLLY